MYTLAYVEKGRRKGQSVVGVVARMLTQLSKHLHCGLLHLAWKIKGHSHLVRVVVRMDCDGRLSN